MKHNHHLFAFDFHGWRKLNGIRTPRVTIDEMEERIKGKFTNIKKSLIRIEILHEDNHTI